MKGVLKFLLILVALASLGFLFWTLLDSAPVIAVPLFLFCLAALILIVVFFVHFLITLEPQNQQGFSTKVTISAGGSINSVLPDNNGWLLVFLLMTVLCFAIAFKVQFTRPPIIEQAVAEHRQSVDKGPGIQKFYHLFMHGQYRTDNSSEKTARNKEHEEYLKQYPGARNPWPWWLWGVGMLFVTIVFVPFALADEAVEAWQNIKEHHERGGHGDIALKEGVVPRILDRIFPPRHHHGNGNHVPHTAAVAGAAAAGAAAGATQATQGGPAPHGHGDHPGAGGTIGLMFLVEFLSDFFWRVIDAARKRNH